MQKERTTLKVAALVNNEGQLGWLPSNPRQWTQSDIDLTAQSLTNDPDFLEDRPLLVIPDGKGFVVFAGNLRLTAARKLKLKEVPGIIYTPESEDDQMTIKRRSVLDNGAFGAWDYDALANEWDDLPLTDWGVPAWEKGLNWNRPEDEQHKSDLAEDFKMYKEGDFYYFACFHSTEEGETLPSIKQDPDNAYIFALSASKLIQRIIGDGSKQNWRLVSAPRRRHKEGNFAEKVCQNLSQRMGITYKENIVTTTNRDRFNLSFTLEEEIEEENIIVYDDIVTTGETLKGMREVFNQKNCVFIVGVENDHPKKTKR